MSLAAVKVTRMLQWLLFGQNRTVFSNKMNNNDCTASVDVSEHVSTLPSTGFGKDVVKHHGTLRLAAGWWRVAGVTSHINKNPLSCSRLVKMAVKKMDWSTKTWFRRFIRPYNNFNILKRFRKCSIWCLRLMKMSALWFQSKKQQWKNFKPATRVSNLSEDVSMWMKWFGTDCVLF